MRAVYTTRARPAGNWQRRRQSAPRELRRAVGLNASLVATARGRNLRETIYQRAPTNRPLSGNLERSEFVQMAGNGARLGNRARYAQRRNAMTGVSKTYGHNLDSHWAQRALDDTRVQRNRNIRNAVRRAMGTKAGGA